MPPPQSTDLSALEGVFNTLPHPLMRAIAAGGYTIPTPIQEQAIPPLLEGRDLLGTAQTGTGKTAAFTLPLLHHLDATRRERVAGRPRALILAPTRELAAQIGDSVRAYGRYLKLRHTVIFGGVSQSRQVDALSKGIDILVATPGRLLDLMGQRYITLSEVEFLVLDEVDRMLDMGFIHDIRRVIAELPDERQSLFFSATMPNEVSGLAHSLVRDPVRIAITPEQPAVERINQSVYHVDGKRKLDLLSSLLWNKKMGKVIVFTKMKHRADKISRKLAQGKIRSGALHGNKSQNARTKTLEGFKNGSIDVLVATDIAARGIDVDGITHVINFDLPTESETYVHRIGRTARASADGEAISFCANDEITALRGIERLLKKKLPVEADHEFHIDPREAAPAPRPARSGRQDSRRSHGNSRGDRRPAASVDRWKTSGRSRRKSS